MINLVVPCGQTTFYLLFFSNCLKSFFGSICIFLFLVLPFNPNTLILFLSLHVSPFTFTRSLALSKAGPLECAGQVIAVYSQLNKEWHIRKKRDKFGHSRIKEQFSALLEGSHFLFSIHHSPVTLCVCLDVFMCVSQCFSAAVNWICTVACF